MKEKKLNDLICSIAEHQGRNSLKYYRSKSFLFTLFITVVLLSIGTPAQASDDVGAVVNLRGRANILREADSISAKLKDPIQLKDTIETFSRSRAKLLFIDESMLTIGSDTRASIEKFVYSKEEGGASIFNLLDGKMRSVVGKTAFEVHTPTTVAAARGTVIDFLVGKARGVPFTIVTCIEGTVLISSADPAIEGVVELKAGQTMTVVKNQPLPKPEQAPVKKIDEREKKETTDEGDATEENATNDTFGDEGPITIEIPALPPIEMEPKVVTIPVNINVSFP